MSTAIQNGSYITRQKYKFPASLPVAIHHGDFVNMDKLTTERLEYYAALPTQPAEGDGFFKKGIFMYEVRRMARQLLAYEQAADRPVGEYSYVAEIKRCVG